MRIIRPNLKACALLILTKIFDQTEDRIIPLLIAVMNVRVYTTAIV